MLKNNKSAEQLHLIQDMNRLFLSYLQTQARQGRDCLGLGAQIRTLVRDASEAQLDCAAELPRALFRLQIDEPGTAEAPVAISSPALMALYSLQSKLLLSASHLARQNAHLAQTFLALPSRTLVRLRGLGLPELANIAETTTLVAAVFEDEPWLWRELLCSESTQALRRARLIAMQPRMHDLTLPCDGEIHARN